MKLHKMQINRNNDIAPSSFMRKLYNFQDQSGIDRKRKEGRENTKLCKLK